MKIPALALMLIINTLFFGCHNGKNQEDPSDLLISSKWILLGIQNTGNRNFDPVPSDLSRMDIVFSNAHRFQAASSCNTAFGSYYISEKNLIRIDSVAMTKMFCIDSVQSSWEEKYIEGLKDAGKFSISNDTLSITSGADLEMIFKAE